MAEILNIDFSTEDLSQFDDVVVGGTNTLAYNATAGHDGGPGMLLTINSEDATYGEKGFTQHAAGTPFGVASYVNHSNLTISTHTQFVRTIYWLAATTLRGYHRILNWNGTLEYAINHRNDSATDNHSAGYAVSGQTWNYVRVTPSSNDSTADGHAKLFLHGVERATTSNIITYNNLNLDRIRVGGMVINPSVSGTIGFGPIIARDDLTEIEEPSAPSATVPDPPADVRIVGTHTTALTLEIDEPLDDGGAEVTQYKIEHRSPAGEGSYALLDTIAADGATTTFTHDGLSPNTSHQYQIKAVNTEGDSAASDPVGATTLTLEIFRALFPTDLTEADAVVEGGTNTITRTADQGINGDPGARIVLNSTLLTYLGFNVPETNPTYDRYLSGGFYLGSTIVNMTVEEGSKTPIAAFYDGSTIKAGLKLTRQSGALGLIGFVVDDDALEVEGPFASFGGVVPEWGELLLERSTNDPGDDGKMWLWLDGNITDILNPYLQGFRLRDTLTFDSFRLGCLSNADDDALLGTWDTGPLWARRGFDPDAQNRSYSPNPKGLILSPPMSGLVIDENDELNLLGKAGYGVAGFGGYLGDSGAISHSWVVTPGGSGVSEQTTQEPSYVAFPNAGNWTLTYTVSDAESRTDPRPETREVQVGEVGPTAPDAPTGLTATAISHNRIDLSWTAPGDDGGEPITGYQIERESPIGGGWSTLIADTGSTSTSFSDVGLTAETQYNYRVAAINSIDVGPASDPDDATTLEVPDVALLVLRRRRG